MVEVYDLNGATVENSDLANSQAYRVTGTIHQFENTDRIIVDNGYFRIVFPKFAEENKTFSIYPRDPTRFSGDADREEFDSSYAFNPVVDIDGGAESISNVQILENTTRRVKLRVHLNSGNRYELQVLHGSPVVEVTTFRGIRNDTDGFHAFGIENDLRWTLLADGEMVEDDDFQNADSSTNTPGNWFATMDDDKPFIVGAAFEEEWEKVDDGGQPKAEVTGAGTGEERRQWVFVLPANVGGMTSSEELFTEQQTASGNNPSFDVTVSAAGWYRLLYAPNDPDQSEVTVDVNSTQEHNDASITQDEYTVSDLVELNEGVNSIDLTINGDGSNDWTFVVFPVQPSSDTDKEDYWTFPGFFGNMDLADKFVKDGLVSP